MTTENSRANALTDELMAISQLAHAGRAIGGDQHMRATLDDVADKLMKLATTTHAASSAERPAAAPGGYCERAGGCVCGGDLPRVREGCSEWVKSEATPAPIWRCFHCDEVFADVESATLHFGRSERQSPACGIDIAEYRAMERRMAAYNEEDSELHRTIYGMQAQHQADLRREEEKGYARGLADGMKGTVNAESGRVKNG
ncbi:hypothetical protein [Burkholderia cenocepacia]|uniref:C2H2-type domain-containing protein n=1 Tax=Burkholderia cenocepacia TaxID=95486 RepID=A0ABD4UPP5_9BURK|nr:hypothetical protein [Burkholderia cenocepacia]MCW3700401.1 hypothetical protein [Burkholderia cenocepacia]MCW3707806.1 hypothetical protein [Burkholderia cenocepacia]MCW3716327.1 hypothetical protein [Burkholderia cenocepacia]MCW3724602.1 hypothetical protein [Burkholderia cenocepacia]MCW3731654.1 hypothetical protein [Burkholderia cenocepacia]